MQRILILVLLLGICTSASPQAQLGPLGGSNPARIRPSERQHSPSVSETLGSAVDLMLNKARNLLGGSEHTQSHWKSNSSPRETVFTFIQGMHLFHYMGEDCSDTIQRTLPSDYEATSAEAIALQSVFDRLGAIHPSDLPSNSSPITKRIEHFEVFPYAVDHEWVWRWLDAPPDGSIQLEKDADGHWRFTTETLTGAPALLESMRAIPPVYANENIQQARNLFLPALEATPWWAWLISALGLVGAFFTGSLSRRLLIKFGDRYEARTKPILGSLFRSISTSVSIIIGTLVFIFASLFIELSPAVSHLYWNCIQVVLLVALVWVIFGMTDLVSTLIRYHIVKDKNEYGEMTVTIIQRAIHTFFFIMIAVFILENVFSFSIGALITGLGILGLALSLAGKETAQNLFGAISIFVNRPFVVGDWVKFKDQIGEVFDVRMQATHIRLLSGEMLIVPNMQFISNEVENLAMRKYLRREMNISLPYATDPEQVDRAIELINDVLRSDEIVNEGKCNLDERPPSISFSDFGDYYLNLKVYYWYFIGDDGESIQRNSERGWFSYLKHCTIVNRAILRAFNKEDIKFAFPTQTIALGQADEGTT